MTPKPLATWDVRHGFHQWEHHLDAITWNISNLPDHGNDTYRLEIYLIDMPYAIAYRYAEQQGNRYIDPQTHSPAVLPPITIPLHELPPPHLWCHQNGQPCESNNTSASNPAKTSQT